MLTQSIGRPPRDWEFLQEAVRMGTAGAREGAHGECRKSVSALFGGVHGYFWWSAKVWVTEHKVLESVGPWLLFQRVYSLV